RLMLLLPYSSSCFFFNVPATTEIYTLSLHDALPISALDRAVDAVKTCEVCGNVDTISPCRICTDPRRAESGLLIVVEDVADLWRSEEHTSELQSRENLVCRLLLEKKKKASQSKTIAG